MQHEILIHFIYFWHTNMKTFLYKHSAAVQLHVFVRLCVISSDSSHHQGLSITYLEN